MRSASYETHAMRGRGRFKAFGSRDIFVVHRLMMSKRSPTGRAAARVGGVGTPSLTAEAVGGGLGATAHVAPFARCRAAPYAVLDVVAHREVEADGQRWAGLTNSFGSLDAGQGSLALPKRKEELGVLGQAKCVVSPH